MTSQGARVGSAIVRNGSSPIGRNHVDIKIDHSFSGSVSTLRAHAMRGMANGTGEAIINVPGMFAKGRVSQDLFEVVALAAQCIGPVNSEIRIGEKICHQLPRSRSLAELVATLQNVKVLRSVRSIRPGAAKFPIVITIVAIRAEDSRSHQPRGSGAVLIQHVCEQAGLRKRAAAIVRHRMTGCGTGTELRHEVERVSRKNEA